MGLGKGETDCNIAGNLCRQHIYCFRALVVAREVTRLGFWPWNHAPGWPLNRVGPRPPSSKSGRGRQGCAVRSLRLGGPLTFLTLTKPRSQPDVEPGRPRSPANNARDRQGPSARLVLLPHRRPHSWEPWARSKRSLDNRKRMAHGTYPRRASIIEVAGIATLILSAALIVSVLFSIWAW